MYRFFLFFFLILFDQDEHENSFFTLVQLFLNVVQLRVITAIFGFIKTFRFSVSSAFEVLVGLLNPLEDHNRPFLYILAAII